MGKIVVVRFFFCRVYKGANICRSLESETNNNKKETHTVQLVKL